MVSPELGDRLVGPVLQVTDQRTNFAQSMKNITAAGNPRQSLLMTGAEPRGEIGDGSLGSKAPVDQFEQLHPPGIGVAMFFQGSETETRLVPRLEWPALRTNGVLQPQLARRPLNPFAFAERSAPLDAHPHAPNSFALSSVFTRSIQSTGRSTGQGDKFPSYDFWVPRSGMIG